MKAFALVAFIAVAATAVVALPDGYHMHGHHGGHHGEVPIGKAEVFTYPVKAPAVKCGHSLVVGCKPLYAPVGCKAHAPAPAHHGGYHHAPAPAHHGHEHGHMDHGHKYHHAPAPAHHGHGY